MEPPKDINAYGLFKAFEIPSFTNVVLPIPIGPCIAKALPTSDITIGYVAGLNEVDESGMTVHPNPATDVLYVNAQGTVIISDMTGQTVKTVKASNAIDVSDLEEGVYILTTESGQTNKFVKK